MSLKRIVTVVVLIVLALVAVYCACDWASVGEITNYVKGGIDASLNAHLHPEEWQIGDVRVVKDEDNTWEAVSYTARLNEDVLCIASGINEQGEAYETGHVRSHSGGYYGIIPSKLKLDQSRLPAEAVEAVTLAQSIASAMRKQKPWPWSLRQISDRVKDISEGRMRVEMRVGDSLSAYATIWLYGRDRIVELADFDSSVKLYLWDDRLVANAIKENTALKLSSRRLTVYAAGEKQAQALTDRLERSFTRLVTVLRASPDAPPGTMERLERAQQWLAVGKPDIRPALDDAQLGKLAEPWELPRRSGPVEGGMESAGAPVTSPVEIAGVAFAEDRSTLSRGGFTFEWNASSGTSWLKPVDGYRGLYITVAEDSPYASTTAEFADDEVNQPLVALRSMARDMCAVPVADWPSTPWRDRLHQSMAALGDGRFYARSVRGPMAFDSRLVFEGSTTWAVFGRFTSSYNSERNFLELGLTADGFALRDTYSGCLLEVKGGAVSLTQTREDADAGLSLHLTEAAALADWATTGEDKLPPDLATSLTQARDFLAHPSLPEATLVDSMEVPDWSLEKIRQRMPARKPSATGG